MALRFYSYVGDAETAASLDTRRFLVRGAAGVLEWAASAGVSLRAYAELTATFIVDDQGDLWIADRQSEHVACARRRRVYSAGEMTFSIEGQPPGVVVTAVTNQSTGYCPEPASWPAVAAALDRAGVDHPDDFTARFLFRRCPACRMRNIVKDDWYVCGVCGAELPKRWNFVEDA